MITISIVLPMTTDESEAADILAAVMSNASGKLIGKKMQKTSCNNKSINKYVYYSLLIYKFKCNLCE
jgi:hypothetical protein